MARIAVIGAGTGAMAAAARLAVAGEKVTVYERSASYGGSVGRHEHEGFVFDTGPGLLHLPAVQRDLFVKTGKESLEQCVTLTQVDPASRHLFADGTAVSLPNASRAGVSAALDGALGVGSGARWSDFMDRARDAWDRSRRPLLEEPLRTDHQVLGRDPYPAVRQRRLLRPARQAATVAEIGAWELADPRLAALLDGYGLAHGLDPRTAPASAALLPYMEQTFGSWYVMGGMRELARAVYERCVARRVEFVFGAEVVRVVEKDGRAAGVELAGGEVAEADRVVLGVRPRPDLVPDRQVWGAGDVPVRAGAGAAGRFTVLLSLRGPREADAVHRTVVHSGDGAAEWEAVFGGRVACPPHGDGAAPGRSGDPAGRGARGGDAHRDGGSAGSGRLAGRGGAAAVRGPPGGAGGRGRARAAGADPAHGDPYAGGDRGGDGSRGRCGAAARARRGRRRDLHPGNLTRLPGLYLAGGWAHPGGGLAHAGMSGTLVAGLVVEGDDFRGSR
ncbi:hypothetical protein SBADM41S_04258 [Streptomyces badius]